jgi:hypothetical protein
MDPQRESQRHFLKDYYTKYYAELRRQLPKYAAASEQVPPFLRSHARIIFISECADGYVITHRTNPTTAGDAAETFVMIADDWDRTVGDATGKDYDPYSDFDESEAPFAREVRSGEYAEPTDFEMRDYVSNDKVIWRTAEAACKEAEVVLQEFFEQNPPLVSGLAPS